MGCQPEPPPAARTGCCLLMEPFLCSCFAVWTHCILTATLRSGPCFPHFTDVVEVAQGPVTGQWRGGWSSCRGCGPNHCAFQPQLDKRSFRALPNLQTQRSLYSCTWRDRSPLTNSYLLASLCALACAPAQVVKTGAGLTVMDGLSADHSLPLLLTLKYLLFVTREQ